MLICTEENEYMNDFLIIDDEDMNFIWNTIQQLQVVFHPQIAPCGKIDMERFFEIKRNKSIVLFVDRNILSGLLNFCENGSLKDRGESQILGLLMTWSEMNDIAISVGFAIQERATQTKNQEEGLKELQKFLEIIETYPGQMWLKIAEGQVTQIPPISFSGKVDIDNMVNYSNGCDHYYMLVASMLHIVKLYRNQELRPADKVIDFLRWTYDNLLLSQYALVYAILLFTGQEYIKAPKGANTGDINRIIRGCENQAWDICYLSSWSTFYFDSENVSQEFMFATNDNLLKRIFINTHGTDGVNGLLFAVFSKKDYNKIYDYILKRQANRNRPDFGESPQSYFEKLIDEEKEQIIELLADK